MFFSALFLVSLSVFSLTSIATQASPAVIQIAKTPHVEKQEKQEKQAEKLRLAKQKNLAPAQIEELIAEVMQRNDDATKISFLNTTLKKYLPRDVASLARLPERQVEWYSSEYEYVHELAASLLRYQKLDDIQVRKILQIYHIPTMNFMHVAYQVKDLLPASVKTVYDRFDVFDPKKYARDTDPQPEIRPRFPPWTAQELDALLDEAITINDGILLEKIAEHPNLSDAGRRRISTLSFSPFSSFSLERVSDQTAISDAKSSTNPERLTALANDANPVLRLLIAQNPHTPIVVLENLLHDPVVVIRAVALLHPALQEKNSGPPVSTQAAQMRRDVCSFSDDLLWAPAQNPLQQLALDQTLRTRLCALSPELSRQQQEKQKTEQQEQQEQQQKQQKQWERAYDPATPDAEVQKLLQGFMQQLEKQPTRFVVEAILYHPSLSSKQLQTAFKYLDKHAPDGELTGYVLRNLLTARALSDENADALVALYANDPRPFVRICLSTSLSTKIQHKKILKSYLQDDVLYIRAMSAANFITQNMVFGDADPKITQITTSILVDLAKHENSDVRLLVAQNLAAFNPTMRAELLAILQEDDMPHIRHVANDAVRKKRGELDGK